MGETNRFTPEFKREAAGLALTSARTRAEVADDLPQSGCHPPLQRARLP